MRVMIIAGEASGDLHGAGVVRELKRLDPDCEIFGVGGDKMQSAGMQLIYHVRELSIMGFWEVLQHLPLIRSVEKTMEALLRARTPDVLLLIDYPGFNLRFARIARNYKTAIVYYISPQVWAWNPGRVKKMKGVIDKMLTVFPFEVDIYKKEGIDVEFVGHPLLEELGEQQSRDEFCKRWTLDHNKKIVGLFPGSRKQELERIFPAMIGAARLLYRHYGSETVVGIASTLEPGYVRSFLRDDFPLTLIQNATHDAMKNSDVAIVTSGTATLETAYLRTPMIVVYKTSMVTYIIGRLLVKIKNIGLVNIVAGRTIVPEILQSSVTPQKLAEAASAILDSDDARTTMSSNLAEVKNNLGTAGASLRVAKTVLSMA
ncbi:MAG TPA: lipid-A-disaccharide synthase [Bacteroidota bacterium]|jgi:lipid-A-disaccharide synthase|nr:lipid-A-disaccharide synthase [Bacteroidota bacterium]